MKMAKKLMLVMFGVGLMANGLSAMNNKAKEIKLINIVAVSKDDAIIASMVVKALATATDDDRRTWLAAVDKYDKSTALHYATKGCRCKTTEVILAAAEKVDFLRGILIANNKGWTALQYAVTTGNIALVELILAAAERAECLLLDLHEALDIAYIPIESDDSKKDFEAIAKLLEAKLFYFLDIEAETAETTQSELPRCPSLDVLPSDDPNATLF